MNSQADQSSVPAPSQHFWHKVFRSKTGIAIFIGILAIILIAVAIIGISASYRRSVKRTVSEISQLSAAGEYQAALELSGKLPKDIRRFYDLYLTYGAELNDWEGSETELLEWLLDAYSSLCEIGYPDDASSRYDTVFLWKTLRIESICEEAEQELRRLEEVNKWYPELHSTVSSFYLQYFDLAAENMNMLKPAAGATSVEIHLSDIAKIDLAMDALYHSTSGSLNAILENLPQKDTPARELVQNDIDLIQEAYTNYCDYLSLSSLYSHAPATFTIPVEAASNNYGVLKEILERTLLPNSDPIDTMFDTIWEESYTRTELRSIQNACSAVNVDIANHMWALFPYATPSISGPLYSPIENTLQELLATLE